MKTGTELIAEERQRQIEVEGWTPEHDDQHDSGKLTNAAICYAEIGYRQAFWGVKNASKEAPHGKWGWDDKWWKPSDDPVRNLVKAGALIAAEIDRLQRLEKP